jgi:hypothetical protein
LEERTGMKKLGTIMKKTMGCHQEEGRNISLAGHAQDPVRKGGGTL